MKPIPFYKMSGAGNDFIIIDNRDKIAPEADLPGFVKGVCRRKISVGADGLILVEPSENVDFKWRFFNSDGSVAEMCGNGARCVARFAFLHGVAGQEMSFETLAGPIHARIKGDGVQIKMTDPHDFNPDFRLDMDGKQLSLASVNTGVPHVVLITDNLDNLDVPSLGSKIRHHPDFAPAGTNVNFVQPGEGDVIGLRTYERGVEDETLACGTGAVAAAIVCAQRYKRESPIRINTRSGAQLAVQFQKSAGTYTDIYLEGDARIIYSAELSKEAWD